MAKQSRATITLRDKQLSTLGYSQVWAGETMSYVHPKIVGCLTSEMVTTTSESKWKELCSEIVGVIDRTAPKPLTQGEETQLSEMVKVVPVVPETGKETASLQTLEVGKFSLTNEEFEKHMPTIKAWHEKCEKLTVTDLSDKAGLKAVTEAKAVTRKTRTTLENVRKDKKAYWLAGGREVDEVANKYFSEIEATENHLDAELKKVEEWKTAEQTRIENEAKAKLDSRVNALKEAGLTFNPAIGMYSLGNVTGIDTTRIGSWPDAEFANVLLVVKAEKVRVDEVAKAEKEAEDIRIATEKKEKEDFATAQKELKEKQDAFELKEKEQKDREAKLLQQRVTLRESRLMGIGMMFCARIPILGESGYYFSIGECEQYVTMSAIEMFTDTEFEQKISSITEVITEAKQQAADAAEKQEKAQKQFDIRCGQLQFMGMVGGDKRFIFTLPNVDNMVLVISLDKIKSADDREWTEQIEAASKAIIEIKAAQQAYEANKASEEQRYNERAAQLVNIGMQLKKTMLNSVWVDCFVKENQFDKIVQITASEVKEVSPENWENVLSFVTAGVAKVNLSTEQELKKIAEAKEAQRPEIDRAREYINAFSLIPGCKLHTMNVIAILNDFDKAVEAKMKWALTELAELENN